MNNSMTLLKIQLLSFLGINEIKYGNDKKQKRGLLLAAMGICLTVIMIAGYSLLSAISLVQGGMIDIIPAYMLTATSIIILVLTIFKTNGILFGFKDYDMLMSLPVKTSSIVKSRFLMVYTLNLMVTLLITIPMGIVYSLSTVNSHIALLMMAMSFLVVPLIPMVVAFFIGAFIIFVASRFKHSNVLITILSFLLVIGVVLINFVYTGQIKMDDIANMSAILVKQMYSIYPVAEIYANAILMNDILELILFMLISIMLFYSFVKLVTWKYCEINTNLISNNTKDNYEVNELGTSSSFIALYKKELRRYLMSSVYILNTSIGVLFLFILTIIIGFFGVEFLGEQINIPELTNMLSSGGPFVISLMLIMSCTTSSAISLEGKNYWILKSLPIDMKHISNSKIAVNLTMLLPTAILSGVVLVMKTEQSVLGMVLLFAMPITYSVFIAVLGLLMNLKFPNFTWHTESMVVKQSISVILTMSVGFVSIALPGIMAFALWPKHSEYIVLISTIIIAAVTQVLYTSMCSTD